MIGDIEQVRLQSLRKEKTKRWLGYCQLLGILLFSFLLHTPYFVTDFNHNQKLDGNETEDSTQRFQMTKIRPKISSLDVISRIFKANFSRFVSFSFPMSKSAYIENLSNYCRLKYDHLISQIFHFYYWWIFVIWNHCAAEARKKTILAVFMIFGLFTKLSMQQQLSACL